MQAIPAVHAALAVQRRKRCTRQATVPGARAVLPKGVRARVPPASRAALRLPSSAHVATAAAFVGPPGPARALQPPAARWCGASRAAQ